MARRPGESIGGYWIAALLGLALRGRRAGEALSVGTLLPAPETIALRSFAFRDGRAIPDRHAGPGRGANRSPELEWSGLPDGTAQLLLVIEDCDAPLRRPVVHLAALIGPGTRGFDEGALGADARTAGVRFVPGFRGRVGYRGPRALPKHGVHRYGFFLFALDAAIPEDVAVRDVDELVDRARGHVLARGRLTGWQEG